MNQYLVEKEGPVFNRALFEFDPSNFVWDMAGK